MVKVRDDLPLASDGKVDIARWVAGVCARLPADAARLRAACERGAAALYAVDAERGFQHFCLSLEMAELLVELQLDDDALVAAVLYRAVRTRALAVEVVGTEFGAGAAALLGSLMRMTSIGAAQLISANILRSEAKDQVENVRRLLVAMIDDARVAVLKIAERVVALRSARDSDNARRRRIAREARELFVPLAGRLGIGHLKWELEDYAFRYLEPQAYRHVARLVAARRSERQAVVDEIGRTMAEVLERNGIDADVQGRAKHLYSIWRKMRSKHVGIAEVYDARAVRIIVPSLRDCYAVLGIVHSMWRHIPHEFDDYIANPKENGYRSIHTAVIGPDAAPLEVQIRTREMHAESELGICAHWAYKSDDPAGADQRYEQKLAWLRQVLEWHEDLAGLGGVGAQLRRDFVEDRIYVLTPTGDVLDLTSGATPIDFAYRVHTSVGHRCRGAKVGGQVVALDTPLRNGQVVEIITGDDEQPQREWLDSDRRWIRTTRARVKVQAFFREQARAETLEAGRRWLQRDLDRAGMSGLDIANAARRMDLTEDALLWAVGMGELQSADVIQALDGAGHGGDDADAAGARASHLVSGAGELEQIFAPCCSPVRGDRILGYVRDHDSVEVHRHDCVRILALAEHDQARLLDLIWQQQPVRSREFAMRIDAWDRPGLLRDVLDVVARERIQVVSSVSRLAPASGQATIELVLELADLGEFTRIAQRIARIRNVISAQRYWQPS